MFKVGGFVVFLVLVIVQAIRTGNAQAQAQAADRAGGCIVCQSVNVVRDAQFATCSDCGYQGRADGGGKLSQSELGSMFEREDRR